MTATATTPDVVQELRLLARDELATEVAAWERERAVPRSVFRRLAATGVFAARWPAGVPAGDLEIGAQLARESALLSAGLAVCVMTHADPFMFALRRSEHGREALAEAEAGEVVGCLALSEPSGGSTTASFVTTAAPEADGWRIDGIKEYVSGFPSATDMVVCARTADDGPAGGLTMFLVPTDAPGVTGAVHDTVGVRSAGTARVELRGVFVPDERRAGPVGSGLGVLLRMLRMERLWLVVAAAAGSELCLETALAFARRRVVGGRPLLERQAIAHRLAEMAAQVDAIQAVAAAQLRAARDGRMSDAACARAKLFVSGAGGKVADDAMQIVAGAGYAHDELLGRLWRDMRFVRIGAGTDDVLRESVFRGLRPGEHATRPEVLAVERLAAR